jgi:hypothetical protein
MLINLVFFGVFNHRLYWPDRSHRDHANFPSIQAHRAAAAAEETAKLAKGAINSMKVGEFLRQKIWVNYFTTEACSPAWNHGFYMGKHPLLWPCEAARFRWVKYYDLLKDVDRIWLRKATPQVSSNMAGIAPNSMRLYIDFMGKVPWNTSWFCVHGCNLFMENMSIFYEEYEDTFIETNTLWTNI